MIVLNPPCLATGGKIYGGSTLLLMISPTFELSKHVPNFPHGSVYSDVNPWL